MQLVSYSLSDVFQQLGRRIIIDMFFAGTNTSSATLNPRALRKAQDEVREVLKGKRKVEESDMSELVYLKLVLNESFRLHLPMPLLVPRETLDEYMPKIIPPLHRVPPT
ncbi:hypothetical protein DVH24_008662 [Malus domestica]|uniref:Cytochrome P450 n=1 Tax=Malus domestica TaxID=3750 RepID=A0A498JRF0_MALDO|nr:hypothetical protein DVH24_008662 [Malus domestica]